MATVMNFQYLLLLHLQGTALPYDLQWSCMWIQNMKKILFHSLHWCLVSCRLDQVQSRILFYRISNTHYEFIPEICFHIRAFET